MPRKHRTGLALVLLLTLLSPLTGCAGLRQSQEFRLCRAATLALLPAGSQARFATQEVDPTDSAAYHLTYTIQPGAPAGQAAPAQDWTTCRFKTGSLLASPVLTAVATSREGTLPPAVLFFLRTYALGEDSGLPASLSPRSISDFFSQRAAAGLQAGSRIAILAMAFSLVFGRIGAIRRAWGGLPVRALLGLLVYLAFCLGLAAPPPPWADLLPAAIADLPGSFKPLHSSAFRDLLAAFLTWLAMGSLLRAGGLMREGGNRTNARTGNSPARFEPIGILVLAAFCAILAGSLAGSALGDGESGLALCLKALAASAVGGVASLSGALLAALAIGMMESLWVPFTDPAWREILILALLACLVLLSFGLRHTSRS